MTGLPRLFAHATVAIAALLVAHPSQAQTDPAANFPNKPIRMIVPFAAGGGNDIFARLVGNKAAEFLGQQFVIENRPAAGGRAWVPAIAVRCGPRCWSRFPAAEHPGRAAPRGSRSPERPSHVPVPGPRERRPREPDPPHRPPRRVSVPWLDPSRTSSPTLVSCQQPRPPRPRTRTASRPTGADPRERTPSTVVRRRPARTGLQPASAAARP